MAQMVDILLMQSFAGGIVIAAILLARRFLLRRARAQWMYALWLIAALRLLAPLQLPAPWLSADASPIWAPETVVVSFSEPAGGAAAQAGAAGSAPAQSPSRAQAAAPAPRSAETASAAPASPPHAPSWKEAASRLWLAGALLTAAYICAVNARCYARLKAHAVRISAPGKIPVYQSCAASPCLAGFFRPRIYVTSSTAHGKILPHILAHETAHAQAHDNFWLLLKNLLCVLYWFHPLVWIAACACARDCECACDERVARNLSPQERIDYAQTLVQLSSHTQPHVAFASAMRSGLCATKIRVLRLLRPLSHSRRAAVLATAFVLLTSAASFATGEAMQQTVKLPEAFETIQDYDVTGRDAVLLADGRLYAGASGQWTLLGEFPQATHVATGVAGTFLCETGESGDTLTHIGPDGSRAEQFLLPKSLRIHRMEVLTASVAFTATDASEPSPATLDPCKAYSLDLASGTLAGIPENAVYGLCADAAGSLYLLHDTLSTDWAVSHMGAAGGEMQEIWRGIAQSASEIAAGNDGLFLLKTDGTIWLRRSPDAPEERVDAALGETEYYHMLRCDGGALYACVTDYAANTQRLVLLETAEPESAPGRTLTIVNASAGTARSAYMEAWMREHYPDVQIQYVNMDTAQLATRLMAGDADMDLIYGHASLLEPYAQSGAFLPLSALPAIGESMEASGFLPYSPALAVNGQTYCVPDMAFAYAYVLNEPLLSSLNLEWPQAPYTWEELANWAVDSLAGTGYQLFSSAINTPAVLYLDAQARAGAAIQLDTPAFRQSMEAYRRLWQAGLIGEGGGENRAIAMEDILGANLPEFAAQGSNRFMPIAGLDENALYPVEIHGYYVYARTQNAGLAQAYLAEYCSARCQNLAEYGLPYYMLLKDPSGFSREEAQFRGQNGIPFAYTPEAESFRLAAAENPLLRTKASVGVRNALGFDTDMRAYLDGDISLDEYIARAQPRIDMVQYE